jgi:hypothetical protein
MWIMTTVLREYGQTLTKGDRVHFLNTTATVESVVLYGEVAEIQLALNVKCTLVKINNVVEPVYLEQLG